MKKQRNLKNPNTEQYIKDVRSVDSDDYVSDGPEDVKQHEENNAVQEKNKKSQKNAETESMFGDSSDPVKSSKSGGNQ